VFNTIWYINQNLKTSWQCFRLSKFMCNLICLSLHKLDIWVSIIVGKNKIDLQCSTITPNSVKAHFEEWKLSTTLFESSSNSTGPRLTSWTQLSATRSPSASPICTSLYSGINKLFSSFKKKKKHSHKEILKSQMI
jgi:hypothetical protein